MIKSLITKAEIKNRIFFEALAEVTGETVETLNDAGIVYVGQPVSQEAIEWNVAKKLEEHGWSRLVSGTAIASKLFHTAVGKKLALVYLSEGDGYNRSLKGDYQSQGSNILEAKGVLIPVTATLVECNVLVDEFANNAECAISQSYAVRLLPTYEEAWAEFATALGQHGRMESPEEFDAFCIKKGYPYSYRTLQSK